MKIKFLILATIIYLLYITISFFSLPEELKYEERKPYRIYQDEIYYGILNFDSLYVKSLNVVIYKSSDQAKEIYTFSFDDVVLIKENQNISIQLDDLVIGTCNMYFECVDLDLSDSYSVEDLSDFSKVTKLYIPNFPGIVNDINIRMFYTIFTLTYILMCILFYYGIFGHDKIDDFLRFTSKHFDRVHWLSAEQNARWAVFSAHVFSLIFASMIFIYYFLLFIAIILM